MALIDLKSVHIDFPVYGVSSRSLKKQLLRISTGGRFGSKEDHVVKIKALDDITLKIDHGERVGLIGHNGSGKSTLLRVISKIYEPTSGLCSVDGKISSLLDISLGMDDESTGEENIFLRGIINGLSRKQIKEKQKEITDFTDLGDYISLPIRTYSSGMRLRLAFAIATAILPEILILDEVVGAGDAAFMQKTENRVNNMINESHIVVIASHDSYIIEKICTKVLWLDAGKINYFGDVKKGLDLYKETLKNAS